MSVPDKRRARARGKQKAGARRRSLPPLVHISHEGLGDPCVVLSDLRLDDGARLYWLFLRSLPDGWSGTQEALHRRFQDFLAAGEAIGGGTAAEGLAACQAYAARWLVAEDMTHVERLTAAMKSP